MGLERFNTNSKNARKTIFCDIDGTLVKFPESFEDFKNLPKGKDKMELLPGTLDKLWEWETAGHNIILTTGRKESMREHTERQLREVGIFWDHLIMGLGPGKRYLINDRNSGNDTAFGIVVDRNEGIGDVNLDSYDNKSSEINYEDICVPVPEVRYTGEAAEAEAIRIAEQRYNEALQDNLGT